MKKAELEAKIDGLGDTVNSLAGVVGSIVAMLDKQRQGKTVNKVPAPENKEKKGPSSLHLPVTLVLHVNVDSETDEPMLSSSGKSVSFKVPKTAPIAVGQQLWIKRESLPEVIPDTITLTIK